MAFPLPTEISTAISKSLSAQDKIVRSTPALDNALANSTAKGIPPIAISPAQGAFVSVLCTLISAKNILEIGTLGGYSTLWFANSVPGVKVTSLEFNAKHRDVALENLSGQDNVDIILGPALETLPKLAEKGEVYDFVFIDASWEEQREYFDWAIKLTRKGGCIYVDNAVRQLTESEEDDPTATALVDYVAKEERVSASLIPTLNVDKKTLAGIADGFLIAVIK